MLQVLCQLPTLRTLRHLNAVATMATAVFAVCTLALAVYNGEHHLMCMCCLLT